MYGIKCVWINVYFMNKNEGIDTSISEYSIIIINCGAYCFLFCCQPTVILIFLRTVFGNDFKTLRLSSKYRAVNIFEIQE